MTRRLRIASMVAALLLLATGCGDDSVDNSDSPSAGNETDVGARPGSEDTEPDTEQAEGANQPEGTNQETDTDETDGETDAESGATSPEESAGTGERGTSDTPPGAEPRSGPEQTIDFPPPGANHVWPDNSVELEATASSGLPVEYRIEDDTGVCILEGNTLRVEQLGGCEVVASQSGNDEFDPAPEVARPFYVGAQTLNVQLEGLPESASASETVTFDVVVEGTVSDTYSAQISVFANGDCSTDVSEEITGDATVEVTVDVTPPSGDSGTCTVDVSVGGQFAVSERTSETFTVEP